MESKEEMMSGQDSLRVIQQMIQTAKKQYSDESFWYLLWGWLVFVASTGHYILAYAGFDKPYLMWMLMPLGGIISIIYGRYQQKHRYVHTYLDELNKYALIAFLVSLCMVLFNMSKLKLNCYPMIMMVYGVWLFISGGGLRFKPLMIGGVINWILAMVSFYATFDVQLLLLALAVLLGYIIPGYMLRNRYVKQQETN